MAIVTPVEVPNGKPEAPVQEVEGEVKSQDIETPEPKKDPMSSHFAALAKKERILREKMRQFQSEKQSFQSQMDQMKTQAVGEWKQKLAQNPWDTLLEAGLSPEQTTQLILNQPKPEEMELKNLKKEIDLLKSSQNQSQDLIKKQQDEQYRQAKKQISSEVKILIDSDASFETIKAMSAEAAVTELIEQTFLKDGYLMSVDAAAKEVEDYLVDQALNLAKLKKVQEKMIPEAPVNSFSQAVKQVQNQKPQSTTLSNRMTQGSAKPLTDRERKQRAILAFQGKL